ncbi:MAG: energy transducer TonB [Acidobacteriota bacterium]|nr:energy transducer TonB [Acidobacteriota bacterium]
MTCLLKRVLPFALTLTIGVALWVIFGHTPRFGCHTYQNYGGIGVGTGHGTIVVNPIPDAEVDQDRPFNPRDVDRKAQVLWRIQPQYTEQARANMIEGTVVLRAVVAENGWLKSIRVVSGLPDGLTEKALEAAGQMKFSPAIKDGRTVAQYIQIEYNFNLY